jgi:hypothetical protein
MSDGLQSPRGPKVITRRPNRSKQRLRIGDKFRSLLLAITAAAVCDHRPLDFGDHGAALQRLSVPSSGIITLIGLRVLGPSVRSLALLGMTCVSD